MNETIYYTGDNANSSGWFSDEGDKLVELAGEYSENRTFYKSVGTKPGNVYQGHCNPRFVTATAYATYFAAVLPGVPLPAGCVTA